LSWPRGSLERPLVLGHRGASHAITENTLEAFALAREEGADGVELDVRLCKSGEVVVFHDDDLARLARRPARIEALTLQQVSEVELEGGLSIPTLSDVFAAVPGWINVEIKPPPSGQVGRWAKAVAEVISASGAEHRVVVTSFHPGVVAWLRFYRRHLDVGCLFHAHQPLPLRRGWQAALLRPAAVHPEHVLIGEREALRWRRAGLAIGAWTVDDPRRAQRLRDLGVTAIITNVPGRIVTAL